MKKRIFLFSIFLAATTASAERITLTSGKVIEGKIVERTDELIKVDTGLGVPVTYYLDEVNDSSSSQEVVQESENLNKSNAKEVSIKEIVEKIKAINSIYYETVEKTSSETPLPGGDAMTQKKVWFKNGYLRNDIYEESANATKRMQIHTPKGSYYYNSFSKETKKSDGLPMFRDLMYSLNLSFLTREEEFEVLGEEMVDGRPTTIVKNVMDFKGIKAGDRDLMVSGTEMKTWIWNESGLPLKQERKAQAKRFPLVFTTIIEYKNYSFDEIPDEIFDVLK